MDNQRIYERRALETSRFGEGGQPGVVGSVTWLSWIGTWAVGSSLGGTKSPPTGQCGLLRSPHHIWPHASLLQTVRGRPPEPGVPCDSTESRA